MGSVAKDRLAAVLHGQRPVPVQQCDRIRSAPPKNLLHTPYRKGHAAIALPNLPDESDHIRYVPENILRRIVKDIEILIMLMAILPQAGDFPVLPCLYIVLQIVPVLPGTLHPRPQHSRRQIQIQENVIQLSVLLREHGLFAEGIMPVHDEILSPMPLPQPACQRFPGFLPAPLVQTVKFRIPFPQQTASGQGLQEGNPVQNIGLPRCGHSVQSNFHSHSFCHNMLQESPGRISRSLPKLL